MSLPLKLTVCAELIYATSPSTNTRGAREKTTSAEIMLAGIQFTRNEVIKHNISNSATNSLVAEFPNKEFKRKYSYTIEVSV